MTLFLGYGLYSCALHPHSDLSQAHTIKFLNLAPETAKRVAKTANRFWFAGIVFSLVSGALKTRRLAAEAKALRLSRRWGEKDLAEEAAREAKLEAIKRYVLPNSQHRMY